MTEQPRKHYVAPAKGQGVTEEVALAMGYALFDKIASEQTQKPRQEGNDRE